MNKLFLMLLLTLSVGAATQTKKIETNYAALIKKQSAKITTLSASFVQKKYLSVLQDEIVTKGTFLLKKPDKIRWHYTTPFIYTITINGSMVTMSDKTKTEKYDMKQSKTFKQMNEIITGSFDGSILTKTDLFSSQFSEDGDNLKLLLTPKDAQFPLKNITIYFDKKGWLVQRVILTEKNKDYTDIQFNDIKPGVKVDDAIFTH